MRKKVITMMIAGVMCLVIISGTNLNAAVIANETALAGIEVSLDNYYKEENGQQTENLKVSETSGAVNGTTMTVEEPDSSAGTTVAAGDTEKDSEEAEEEEEDSKEKKEVDISSLISNMNYDRLGIAKVTNYLNVRKKPNENAKIVGKMVKNSGCHVYWVKKGWAKIKSGDVTGYVCADYLLLDEKAEQYALTVAKRVATVETTTLNVRFLPDTNSSIYTLVPEGEELTVVKRNLTEEYVTKVMKSIKGDDKQYIQDVKKSEMMKNLDDWMCVRVDNDKVFIAKEFVSVSYQLKKAVKIKADVEKKEGQSKDSSSKSSSSGSSSSGSSSSESTGSSVRSSMVSYAMQFLGNPYVYGGTSLTNGTDCSGFTQGIYSHFGYSIPRTSSAQAAASTTISSSDLRPGDLIFYGSGNSVSHVAMYIGGGQVIHASNPSDGIKISNAFYRTPIKCGRFIY
ncbi:MAG: NlpC/P60 family protein [Clostridiales bacterium]|nr:NlpC/P60 family protein [Clostridiales bacterium]